MIMLILSLSLPSPPQIFWCISQKLGLHNATLGCFVSNTCFVWCQTRVFAFCAPPEGDDLLHFRSTTVCMYNVYYIQYINVYINIHVCIFHSLYIVYVYHCHMYNVYHIHYTMYILYLYRCHMYIMNNLYIQYIRL